MPCDGGSKARRASLTEQRIRGQSPRILLAGADKRRLGPRRHPAARRSQPSYLAPGFDATTTKATTSLICFAVSLPTNVGIRPPALPESWFITRDTVSRLFVSTGPAFALLAIVPAGFSVWQLPHLARKTTLPARGLPAPSAGATRPSAPATTPSVRTSAVGELGDDRVLLRRHLDEGRDVVDLRPVHLLEHDLVTAEELGDGGDGE